MLANGGCEKYKQHHHEWCESSAQRPCSSAQNEEYLHLLIIVVLQQRLDGLVEVTLKHTHFALAVYLKLTLCLFDGLLMRHGTTAFQDILRSRNIWSLLMQ